MSTTPILEAREDMIASGALRVDSKMRNLSPEHFEQVVGWLLEPMPPRMVIELCTKELKLPPAKVPSATALYGFWQSFGPFWLRSRRKAAAEAARQAGKEAAESPVDWDRANADAIQQLTYEILSDPNFDPKTAKAFVTATLKIRDQDIAKRRVEMLEAKMQQAKEALQKVASKGGLTPETRTNIEQALSLL